MIVVRLYAGLGNQLFQYSFARFLSRKYNTELWLDLSWYQRKNAIRAYELDHFKIKYQNVYDKEIEKDKQSELTLLEEWELEKSYEGWQSAVRSGDNIILDGYWATFTEYLHESDFREIICSDLGLMVTPIDSSYKYFRALLESASSEAVSLHVRRGDYLKHKNLFEILDQDYYQRAIELIENQIQSPRYFVFSDDILWVEENFKFLPNATFVNTGSNINDLDLMKRCHHNIIANSTYSWWGAFLNKNSQKKIIAPSKWFTDSDAQALYEATNFIPPKWKRA